MPRIHHIRWNLLHLDIPQKWEVIVKDVRHLIIEADLKPLLEIRWRPPGTKSGRSTIGKLALQLQQEAGYTRRPELLERLPDNLKSKFDVQAFGLDHASGEPALLLTCNSCAATILVRLYHNALNSLSAHPFVFDSLHCHPSGEAKQIWRIQDFFFWLPDGFELEACSFQFGITNLTFKSRTADLNLFRLAPASQHLNKSSLEALFESLCSALREKQVAATSSTLRYQRQPKLAELLWSRVRRRKSYRAATLSHFPPYDRILGYTISSHRPIEDDLKTMIENGYGIVQEKKADAGPDPGSGTGLHTGQK